MALTAVCFQFVGETKQKSDNSTAYLPKAGNPYNIILKIVLRKNLYSNEYLRLPGQVDTTITLRLNEHLKAVAALYAAMVGTNCDNGICELTTALGLGKQGSEQHKNIIRQYFPEDKVAEAVVRQDCYVRPSGASTFSYYEYLTIIDAADTVRVDYAVAYYDHGNIESNKATDVYVFKNNTFQKIKRNLWKHIDKK